MRRFPGVLGTNAQERKKWNGRQLVEHAEGETSFVGSDLYMVKCIGRAHHAGRPVETLTDDMGRQDGSLFMSSSITPLSSLILKLTRYDFVVETRLLSHVPSYPSSDSSDETSNPNIP
jgi:hypothetical protein